MYHTRLFKQKTTIFGYTYVPRFFLFLRMKNLNRICGCIINPEKTNNIIQEKKLRSSFHTCIIKDATMQSIKNELAWMFVHCHQRTTKTRTQKSSMHVSSMSSKIPSRIIQGLDQKQRNKNEKKKKKKKQRRYELRKPRSGPVLAGRHRQPGGQRVEWGRARGHLAQIRGRGPDRTSPACLPPDPPPSSWP